MKTVIVVLVMVSAASLHASDGADCLNGDLPRAPECMWRFAGEVAMPAQSLAISCPTTPIVFGVRVRGTLNQNTDCRVVIPTNFGSVNALADVYAAGQVVAGAKLRVTLESDDSQNQFGLPYAGLVNSKGDVVIARIGTTFIGGNKMQVVLDYNVTTTGEWQVLVSGVGGPLSTAFGGYTVLVERTMPPKRRAVRK